MSAPLVRLVCPGCGQRAAVRGETVNVPRCHKCNCNLAPELEAKPPEQKHRYPAPRRAA